MSTEPEPFPIGLWLYVSVVFGVLIGGIGQIWAWTAYGPAGQLLIPIVIVAVFVGALLVSAVAPRLSDDVKWRASTAGIWLLRVAGTVAGVALVWFGISLIADYTPECVPSETVRCVGVRNGQDVGEVTTGEQRTQNFLVSLIPIAAGLALLVPVAWSIVNARRHPRPRPAPTPARADPAPAEPTATSDVRTPAQPRTTDQQRALEIMYSWEKPRTRPPDPVHPWERPPKR